MKGTDLIYPVISWSQKRFKIACALVFLCTEKVKTNCLIWNICLDLTRMKDSDQFSFKNSAHWWIPSKLCVFAELAFSGGKLLSSGIFSLSLTHSNKMIYTWNLSLDLLMEESEVRSRAKEGELRCPREVLWWFCLFLVNMIFSGIRWPRYNGLSTMLTSALAY